MDFGNLFFSAYGRIRRQDFWLAWVILFAVGTFLSFIPIVNFIAWFVLVYCGVCIRSKRLHDMGRSGWWQLVPMVVNTAVCVLGLYFLVAAIMAGVAWPEWNNALSIGAVAGVGTFLMAVLAACLVELGFLLWIGVAEGEAFDNEFGPMQVPAGLQPAL